jgi:hypothetical protein
MSTTTDGANLSAEDFNLDEWIDEVVRPEVTVELYPYEVDYARRLKAIEDQIPAAEASSPESRGMDEPSIETLLAQVADLRAERAKTTLRVRLRQPLQAEFTEAAVRAKKAGAPEREWPFWQIATACVDPAFSPEQLRRLYARDRSGEAMWGQLIQAVNGLLAGLPVPSSPAP